MQHCTATHITTPPLNYQHSEEQIQKKESGTEPLYKVSNPTGKINPSQLQVRPSTLDQDTVRGKCTEKDIITRNT